MGKRNLEWVGVLLGRHIFMRFLCSVVFPARPLVNDQAVRVIGNGSKTNWKS